MKAIMIALLLADAILISVIFCFNDKWTWNWLWIKTALAMLWVFGVMTVVTIVLMK